MKQERHDDRLGPVEPDEDGEPRVYAAHCRGGDPGVTRRAFFGTLGMGVLAAGCSEEREPDPDEERAYEEARKVASEVAERQAKQKSEEEEEKKIQTCGELHAHKKAVSHLLVVSGGERLLSTAVDGVVGVWTLPEGKPEQGLKAYTFKGGPMALDPQGRFVAFGSPKGDILLRNPRTLEEITTLEGHKSAVKLLAISPDGERLASCAKSGNRIIVWSSAWGRKQAELTGHVNPPESMAFVDDGKELVSGARGEMEFWRVSDGTRLTPRMGGEDVVGCLAGTPDGKFLVGCVETRLVVWELPGVSLLANYNAHRENVNALALSPDGKMAATASQDRTVILWRIPDGKILQRFEGHSAGVTAVAFTPDGEWLITGAADRTIRQWSLPDGARQACVYDESVTKKNTEAGRISIGGITYTMPCGSPVPSNATCTCNCVSVGFFGGGGGVRTSHYWYPN
ncbi:MAG: WD40 repeat domain-containing protein [Desulfatibacillaceae bacterium]